MKITDNKNDNNIDTVKKESKRVPFMTYNKDDFYRLLTALAPVVLVLQVYLLMLTMQRITFSDDDIFYAWMTKENTYYILLNFLIFAVPVFLIYVLSRKLLLGWSILEVFVLITSVANNMKYTNLKECITVFDISKLSEAMGVTEDADFLISSDITFYAAYMVLMLSVCLAFDIIFWKKKEMMKTGRKPCIIILAVCASCLVGFLIHDSGRSSFNKLTEAETGTNAGPIVYFVESVMTKSMEKPYDAETAKKTYEAYVEKGRDLAALYKSNDYKPGKVSKSNPNVIVIMSEAFYDVNKLEGAVSYEKDPMKDFYKVKEKSAAYGDCMVNIYGGSTHYSEYEFLTGWNTKGMGLGSCPYKEFCYKQTTPSVANYFEERGYYNIAIHPYDGRFYRRYMVYPRMGFNEFVDRNGMMNTDMCGFISDDALTKEIIYRYEKLRDRSDAPMFNFNVSMQNHIAIINREKKQNVSYDFETTFDEGFDAFSNAKKKRFGNYISGISRTGKALLDLTKYFEKCDEPTVILFFGDHAPSYAKDILDAGNLPEEDAYSTPFILWANYDLSNEDASNVTKRFKNSDDKSKSDSVNASFLSTYLLMKLGMELPDQSLYNIGVTTDYPINTRYIVRSSTDKNLNNMTGDEKTAYFNRELDIKRMTDRLSRYPQSEEMMWK